MKRFTLGAADKLLPNGIIENAIAPGPVATAMLGKGENDSIYKEGQPSGRYGLPIEIANMAVLLVSDVCNLVVGDTLFIIFILLLIAGEVICLLSKCSRVCKFFYKYLVPFILCDKCDNVCWLVFSMELR